MFLGEKVRFCKDCKLYRTKDWSVVNNECKAGKKTPDGGHTAACNRYEGIGNFSGNNHCRDCARWDEGFLYGRCIKGLPTPKGRDSDKCIRFAQD